MNQDTARSRQTWDSGATAGLHFSLGEQQEDSPIFRLLQDLADTHRMDLDFNQEPVKISKTGPDIHQMAATLAKAISAVHITAPCTREVTAMTRHYHPDFRTTLTEHQDKPPELHLNAASISSCRRAIIYKVTNTWKPSDITNLDRTGIHTDNVLINVVTEAMRRSGWKIQPTHLTSAAPELYSDWRPHPNIRITGLPHAYGSHILLTQDEFTTITTTWNTEQQTDASLEQGLIKKIAAFYQANAVSPKIDNTLPATLASLDMTTLRVNTSFIQQPQITQANEETADRLQELSKFLQDNNPRDGHLPDRDFPKSSTQCLHCPWRATCWLT